MLAKLYDKLQQKKNIIEFFVMTPHKKKLSVSLTLHFIFFAASNFNSIGLMRGKA